MNTRQQYTQSLAGLYQDQQPSCRPASVDNEIRVMGPDPEPSSEMLVGSEAISGLATGLKIAVSATLTAAFPGAPPATIAFGTYLTNELMSLFEDSVTLAFELQIQADTDSAKQMQCELNTMLAGIPNTTEGRIIGLAKAADRAQNGNTRAERKAGKFAAKKLAERVRQDMDRDINTRIDGVRADIEAGRHLGGSYDHVGGRSDGSMVA